MMTGALNYYHHLTIEPSPGQELAPTGLNEIIGFKAFTRHIMPLCIYTMLSSMYSSGVFYLKEANLGLFLKVPRGVL